MEDALDPVAVVTLLAPLAGVVGVEVYGWLAGRRRGDTYSELWWWLMRRLPRSAQIAVAGGLAALLGWAYHHLIFGGGL